MWSLVIISYSGRSRRRGSSDPEKKQNHRKLSWIYIGGDSFLHVTESNSELPRDGQISQRVREVPVVDFTEIVQQGDILCCCHCLFPCMQIERCTAVVHVGLSRAGSLICVHAGFVFFRPQIQILPCGLQIHSGLVGDISPPVAILPIYSPELLNSVRQEEVMRRANERKGNHTKSINDNLNTRHCSLRSALPLSQGLWLQWRQPSAQVSSLCEKNIIPSFVYCWLMGFFQQKQPQFSKQILTSSCLSAVQQFVSAARAYTAPSWFERPSAPLLLLQRNMHMLSTTMLKQAFKWFHQ